VKKSLKSKVLRWWHETFDGRRNVGPAGVWDKFLEEVEELREAQQVLDSADPLLTDAQWKFLKAKRDAEAADVAISFAVWLELADVDEDAAVALKLEVLRSRTWAETDTPGVYRHV
jgi:hypothetical protein